jgi:alkanesulfonate monooxygenase SsuD/methylene tetrahydromethanopterin reductase-like flavin-dependent oxidoreductase (luciferase family)
LETLAAECGRTFPAIAVGVSVGIDQPPGVVDAVTQALSSGYGFSEEHAKEIVIAGSAPEVAERLTAYAAAGAGHLLIGTFGESSTAVYERLAEVAALMR